MQTVIINDVLQGLAYLLFDNIGERASRGGQGHVQ